MIRQNQIRFRQGLPLLWRTACVVAAILIYIPCSATEILLSTIDGVEHRGDMLGLNDKSVLWRAQGKEKQLAVDGVHWLKTTGRHATSAAYQHGVLELLDGSLVPVHSLTTNGATLAMRLAAPLGVQDEQAIEIDYQQAASYVFQQGDRELRGQWRRIRSTPATSDLIVIKRRDGQTLDYVEGIVTAVQDGSLSVDLQGDQIEVDRSRVYGVVCFRPDAEPARGAKLIRVRTAIGELRAKRVDWADGPNLVLDTPTLGQVRVPLRLVDSIDYSRGGVLLLSDAEPQGVRWRPFFRPPGDLGLVSEWGELRRDRSYSGGPITLQWPGGQVQTFSKGLAIRSEGEAIYAVPVNFEYFRATVGVDPTPRARGAVELRIEGDGQQLFARPFASGEAPFEIELPISQVKQLKLVVDYGQGTDAGDYLHLGNARFTK